ncbi:MAG: hypothetical protein RBU21_08940 [FCB group bacterium]|jgi:hypothetical protein|nr:hypothetical protein [FCB group bacterium]
MELLDIASTQPGHVIAQAVTNPDGMILCPPGFRLTEAAIDRLKRVGVASVAVENSGGAQARLRERLTQLDARFRKIEDPLLLRIREIVKLRLETMLAALDE